MNSWALSSLNCEPSQYGERPGGGTSKVGRTKEADWWRRLRAFVVVVSWTIWRARKHRESFSAVFQGQFIHHWIPSHKANVGQNETCNRTNSLSTFQRTFLTNAQQLSENSRTSTEVRFQYMEISQTRPASVTFTAAWVNLKLCCFKPRFFLLKEIHYFLH